MDWWKKYGGFHPMISTGKSIPTDPLCCELMMLMAAEELSRGALVEPLVFLRK